MVHWWCESGDQMQIDRLQKAVERFDAANREDPNKERFEGRAYPKALLYSQRMTEWLGRVASDASEALRLASRCQHICRWSIPRSDYPAGRIGYRKWRTTLAKFHAEKAEEILQEIGYDRQTIARVKSLVRKENLEADPETQQLEDVICLVFLESYFSDFARQHDENKLRTIIRKTWKKMSPRGRKLALSLPLSDIDRELIQSALQ